MLRHDHSPGALLVVCTSTKVSNHVIWPNSRMGLWQSNESVFQEKADSKQGPMMPPIRVAVMSLTAEPLMFVIT